MLSASLDMLEDSLNKKIEVMTQIEKENEAQRDVLKDADDVDEASFDATVDRKGELIDKLNLLDDGFEALYADIKKDLEAERDQHKEQIARLQTLIHTIMDKSASIEAQEHRNKKLAEKYFSVTREKLAAGKKSSSVAFNYYQTMNKFRDIPPQFMDEKN
ncbi:flagellar export chaperone FlgN [Butyrivibrio proteoclasticus]|uniref:flagellar export chaperone FlgN n=1 Tax=Butyrivibrio proteoclasticus TaxID=43305 RepID=UPI0005567BB9|nr:hypothetical protein [Butyrivibrio proteoclasticus]